MSPAPASAPAPVASAAPTRETTPYDALLAETGARSCEAKGPHDACWFTRALAVVPPGHVDETGLRFVRAIHRRPWDPRGAEADLDAAIGLRPLPMYLRWRAELRLAWGDAKGALADLDRLDHLGAWEHWKRSTALLRLGRPEEAEAAAAEAMRLDPEWPAPFVARARARAARGDVEGAIRDLEQRASDDPHAKDVRAELARIHLAAGRFAEAIRRASEAIGMSAEQDRELYALSAEAMTAKGDAVGATLEWERVIDLSPGDPQPLLRRAAVYLSVDLPDRALPDLDRALALDSSLGPALSMRARARAETGDALGAVADATAALASNPDDSRARLARGVARIELLDWAGADEDLSVAIKAYPDDWFPYLQRARARSKLGDPAGADADTRKGYAIMEERQRARRP